MYSGSNTQHVLREVERRQGELREQARVEAEARRASGSFRTRSPAAFRLWRLHVMVWIEDARS